MGAPEELPKEYGRNMAGIPKKAIRNIFFTGCDATVKEGKPVVAYLQINGS
jgi:hypothetical protein